MSCSSLSAASNSATGGRVEPFAESQYSGVDSYHVVPDYLNFGEVAAGATYSVTFEFFNDGDTPIELYPDLSGCYLFTVFPQFARVGPNSSRTFILKFRSHDLGRLSCEMGLGPGLDAIPLEAVVREPDELVSLSTDNLHFRGVHSGDWRDATVQLTNHGTADLELTAVVPGFTPFRLVDTPDGSAVTIAPGTTNDYVLRFEPNFGGQYFDSLVFLGLDFSVNLSGSCIPLDGDVVVDPWILEYGNVSVDVSGNLAPVTITNYRDTGVMVEPRMEPEIREFIRAGDWQPRTLYPGESRDIWVNCYPWDTSSGEFSTTVLLGADLPSVPVKGGWFGRRLLAINYLYMDFGKRPVGQWSQLGVVVSNPTDEDVEMDVFLSPEDSPLVVVGAEDLTILPRGSTVHFEVGFEPAQEGDYSAVLHLCPDVRATDIPIYASARRDIPTCVVAEGSLEFPRIPAGSGSIMNVTVTNPGTGPLHLSPYVDCTAFRVLSATTKLEPGGCGKIVVAFAPTSIGEHECRLSLGNDICSEVFMTGSAFVGPPPGFTNDRVGVYFDHAFSVPWIFDVEDRRKFEAYIVLKNPLGPADVTGFECMLLGSDRLLLEDVVLPPGAFNFSTLPEFTVGLGTPQPSSDSILLATLSYMALGVPDNEPIALVPKPNPSIPDAMALISGPEHVLRPMYPISGLPIVAWVNYWDRSVGIDDPAVRPEVPPVIEASRLLPNVPNPFNPETTIRFELSRPARLRVDVFDAAGSRVAALLNEERPAGAGQVIWKGRDDKGRTVSSGTYYVRMQTPRMIDTRKIMLLK